MNQTKENTLKNDLQNNKYKMKQNILFISLFKNYIKHVFLF